MLRYCAGCIPFVRSFPDQLYNNAGNGPRVKPVAAVKIVPFGGENQQTMSEIFQEMRITREMSGVASHFGAGFVRVLKYVTSFACYFLFCRLNVLFIR